MIKDKEESDKKAPKKNPERKMCDENSQTRRKNKESPIDLNVFSGGKRG